jgi:hypothetical protein
MIADYSTERAVDLLVVAGAPTATRTRDLLLRRSNRYYERPAPAHVSQPVRHPRVSASDRRGFVVLARIWRVSRPASAAWSWSIPVFLIGAEPWRVGGGSRVGVADRVATRPQGAPLTRRLRAGHWSAEEDGQPSHRCAAGSARLIGGLLLRVARCAPAGPLNGRGRRWRRACGGAQRSRLDLVTAKFGSGSRLLARSTGDRYAAGLSWLAKPLRREVVGGDVRAAAVVGLPT